MLEFNGTLKLQEILEGEDGRLGGWLKKKGFYLIPTTYQNGAVLVIVGNPNFSKKGRRFGIYFKDKVFLQTGSLF
jgi:hypothetical protein